MEPCRISKTLMRRLPLYLNYLKSLPDTEHSISSTSIANALGLGAVQVRKDLAKVSGEGRCRTGRSREQLIQDLENSLNLATASAIIIVGAGRLGMALLDYRGFEEAGLNVLACFDSDPAEKQSETGKPIYSMSRLSSFCKYYDVRVGVIAVPAEGAQSACDSLVACGIQAIWNFAPVRLNAPDNVVIQNENLAASLTALCLQLKENHKKE